MIRFVANRRAQTCIILRCVEFNPITLWERGANQRPLVGDCLVWLGHAIQLCSDLLQRNEFLEWWITTHNVLITMPGVVEGMSRRFNKNDVKASVAFLIRSSIFSRESGLYFVLRVIGVSPGRKS